MTGTTETSQAGQATSTARGVRSEQERMDHTRAILSGGARADTRGARRIHTNRSGNILLGALLHAGARLEAGLTLTDLEQHLVQLVSTYVPVPELRAFGRAYSEALAAGPVPALPETVTRRSVESGYSLAEFTDNLPTIGQQVLAQPNARVVDLGALAPDEPIDDDAFTTALADHGRGLTIVTGPPVPDASTLAALTVRLRMDRFHCVRESGESGRDEIYWAVGAGSDTTARKSFTTREYGAVSTGDTETFDYSYGDKTYIFNGTVDQHLTAEIECWEADHSSGGFYNDLRSALSDFARYAARASSELTTAGDNETARAAAWAAFMSVGASLLNAILGWLTNDDDLVCERSIGFTRAGLLALAARPNNEDVWHFNGGDGGYHKLYLRINDL
ncbi:hypothetical protein [Streptoalloteichus hindustanus]|uniref:Uncharacterized protein n=1 Tax=Streptoalloteichus hindustanus TaxID=2017 RepID=A0A1M5PXQ0_STRHI|nr:hypothetical protein [Streptoalloteichus hindustanus]SHH06311.1 hypothetical protein SAMN05444320_12032 [Streptoalloteichus hindustanus]